MFLILFYKRYKGKNTMPKRREVIPSGGSDRVRDVGGPSESNKRRRWSAERHATVQGSLSSSNEISAILGKFAFQETSHENMISFSLNDQQEYQEQQGSSNQDTQTGPDQASASNVEQVDEAKCQRIVEQLINSPKRMLSGMNEKELVKILNIIEEKKSQGEINNEKYEIYKKKIKKSIYNARYHKYNRDAILVKQSEYREKNKDVKKEISAEYYKEKKDTILVKQAEYREKNKDAIKVKRAKRYKNNICAILAENAEKSVQKYQEALQKVNDAIVALEQEITSLQRQPSLSADTKQLLAKKQRLLRKQNTSKKRSEEALARNLEKVQRFIQIQQELDELLGREAPSHRDGQASLPNAAEESSSHHATQEIRPLEERYHHWLAHAHTSHAAHLIGTAQDLYAEYHELQRHFEEELGPLLADFA
jgi:hypothetical protein